MANPKKLRWIAEAGEKDDPNDSFVIAFLASVGALPTVWMPDEETYPKAPGGLFEPGKGDDPI